jgi:hypothetical protein
MTEVEGFKILRSPFSLYIFIGEFSGHSNDIIVDLVSNEAISAFTVKLLSEALNHDVIRVNGQSYAAIKLICIRFRVNSPFKRQSEIKSILRLKDLKFNKRAKKKRNKAS